MPRLLRPFIPVEVRCRVAMRQLGEMWPDGVIAAFRLPANRSLGGLHALLDTKLRRLAELLDCTISDLRLDHDPALGAREKVMKRGVHVGYVPDANDPAHLVYREKHAHQIKTNIRGDGAQHPDRVLIKRERRRAKGVITKRTKKRWPSGRKIPSRPDAWGKR